MAAKVLLCRLVLLVSFSAAGVLVSKFGRVEKSVHCRENILAGDARWKLRSVQMILSCAISDERIGAHVLVSISKSQIQAWSCHEHNAEPREFSLPLLILIANDGLHKVITLRWELCCFAFRSLTASSDILLLKFTSMENKWWSTWWANVLELFSDSCSRTVLLSSQKIAQKYQ